MSQNPNPAQIRAAISLLNWDNVDLAKACKVTDQTISNIKRGATRPQPRILSDIKRVLEFNGVEFIENSGVRMRPSGLDIYEGPERFEVFTDFVYEQTKAHGGDICLSVTDERLFAKYRTNTTVHYERMQKLYDRGVFKSFRILANKSNFATTYTYNTYKWQPEEGMAPTAFYMFADYLALISFEHTPPPYVLVIRSAPLADAYRRAFNASWAAAKAPPKNTAQSNP